MRRQQLIEELRLEEHISGGKLDGEGAGGARGHFGAGAAACGVAARKAKAHAQQPASRVASPTCGCGCASRERASRRFACCPPGAPIRRPEDRHVAVIRVDALIGSAVAEVTAILTETDAVRPARMRDVYKACKACKAFRACGVWDRGLLAARRAWQLTRVPCVARRVGARLAACWLAGWEASTPWHALK
jgi:hypothetical protein